jgi:trehalose/maltose hydrolase-like predicted phosphorylase
VKLYQLHVNGDVAFAARQYLSATRDQQWLSKEKGLDLITNLAQFWSSRITYNSTKQEYEILSRKKNDLAYYKRRERSYLS